jgi:Domain of unknown function (DUF4926)
MIREHDCVALTADLPDSRLAKGDVGAVVFVHDGGRAYEVEFVTLTGGTIALVTLQPSQVRPILPDEIANARSVDLASPASRS